VTCCAIQEPKRVGLHRLWMWCAAGLLVFLPGCSLTLLAYHYADRLILWQVDHYFDLTSDQRHELGRQLKPLLARHKHEAIPQYEAALVQVRQRIERGLTSQDVDWAYATYDRLRADLFNRIIADGGVFLASIEPEQVQTLETALQKENSKVARLVQAPAPERLKKRANATVNELEDWLGALSKGQKAQIHELSLALPDTQQFWATNQQQRQQDLLALLRQPRTPEGIARELRTILVVSPDLASHAYQDAIRQMRVAMKTMALAIDQRLTADQRRHGVKKLQRLIDQLHALQTE